MRVNPTFSRNGGTRSTGTLYPTADLGKCRAKGPGALLPAQRAPTFRPWVIQAVADGSGIVKEDPSSLGTRMNDFSKLAKSTWPLLAPRAQSRFSLWPLFNVTMNRRMGPRTRPERTHEASGVPGRHPTVGARALKL